MVTVLLNFPPHKDIEEVAKQKEDEAEKLSNTICISKAVKHFHGSTDFSTLKHHQEALCHHS